VALPVDPPPLDVLDFTLLDILIRVDGVDTFVRATMTSLTRVAP
jgi:hypothetical protein